jgi:ferritin-like metal-binding protein YciE
MGRGFSRIVAVKDDTAATMAQMRTRLAASTSEEPAGKVRHVQPSRGSSKEGVRDTKNADDPDVLDASMTADAQAVEHYKIARYGILVAWANQLGWTEAATLMNQTLEEEYDADKTLTELAESKLNRG